MSCDARAAQQKELRYVKYELHPKVKDLKLHVVVKFRMQQRWKPSDSSHVWNLLAQKILSVSQSCLRFIKPVLPLHDRSSIPTVDVDEVQDVDENGDNNEQVVAD